MAIIEISTAPTDTIDVANDYIPFVDVSETPDGTNKATFASIFGQNLVDIRALADPAADRLLFWDDSAGAYAHLTLGTNLSITGTTINAAGGGVTNSAGNNVIAKSDGTNLIASTISQSGSTITLGSASDASTTLSVINSSGVNGAVICSAGGMSLGHPAAIGFGDVDFFPIWGQMRPEGLMLFQGWIEGVEITAPAAPAANGYRLYAEDSGGGKTRVMILFASGASQQIAIEP